MVAAVGNRDNYCRASNAGDPCSCASPLPDSLYYCCYLLLSARLCDYCTTYVAELITPPLDSASSDSCALALMRLPTHTRPCSARALCNTATLSSSSLHPASLPPSSFLRRKAVAGQSRVLLTASPARGQQQHQQSQAATAPLRSPLQWSNIAHRARNPTYSLPAVNMAGQQVRAHSHGHGHGGHHHHHDTTFLTSANKSDPGVRITRVGLYVNLGMAVAKGAGGYIFNSQA